VLAVPQYGQQAAAVGARRVILPLAVKPDDEAITRQALFDVNQVVAVTRTTKPKKRTFTGSVGVAVSGALILPTRTMKSVVADVIKTTIKGKGKRRSGPA